MSAPASDLARLAVADVMVVGLLSVMVAAGTWQRSADLHPVLYQYQAADLETSDRWFDADVPRMSCVMTDREATQLCLGARPGGP